MTYEVTDRSPTVYTANQRKNKVVLHNSDPRSGTGFISPGNLPHSKRVEPTDHVA